MLRTAVVAGVEFLLPPIEEFEGAIRVGDFIAEIIGPAAIGVDVVEMLVEFFGKEPGDNVEIFVVMGGKPARVFLRGFNGAAWGRNAGSEFEFVGIEHFRIGFRAEAQLSPCLNSSP
jgi:hypothetical protein